MKQGTTPTLTITTDMDVSGMDAVELTIKDSAGAVHKWQREQLEVLEDAVRLTLSQEDTFGIAPGYITVQLRVKHKGGVFASDVMRTRLEEILAGEVEL